MVDNLKSAVLQRSIGQAPVFNPRYADFARHHRFEIAPCNVRAGHEKGRVEAGVGYVKKNFLAGLDIPDFRALNPAARHWLDSVANVRVHGETHKRPLDLFALERDPATTPPRTPLRPRRRAHRERRIRLARFPVKKTLDSFDWSWPIAVEELRALERILAQEPVGAAVDELHGVVALELAERPRVAVDADVVQRRRLAPHDRAPTEMGLDVGVLLPNILPIVTRRS